MLQEGDGVFILRTEAPEQHDRRQRERDQSTDQAVADERAPTEARLLVCLLEDLDSTGPGLFCSTHRMANIDALMIAHERLAPVHGADSEGEQCKGEAEADEEVVQAHGARVCRINGEYNVRRDRPDAADDGQVEEGVDGALRLSLCRWV